MDAGGHRPQSRGAPARRRRDRRRRELHRRGSGRSRLGRPSHPAAGGTVVIPGDGRRAGARMGVYPRTDGIAPPLSGQRPRYHASYRALGRTGAGLRACGAVACGIASAPGRDSLAVRDRERVLARRDPRSRRHRIRRQDHGRSHGINCRASDRSRRRRYVHARATSFDVLDRAQRCRSPGPRAADRRCPARLRNPPRSITSNRWRRRAATAGACGEPFL